MVKRRLIPTLLAAGLVLAGPGRAEPPAPVTEGPTVHLPDMQVDPIYELKDFKFPLKAEVAEADFANGSAPLRVTYPGKAFTAGVPTGRATVGVMLDARGRPVDFLVVRYTQPFFAEALMEEARDQRFAPRHLLGAAVPGSFHFTYNFRAPAGLNNISSFDALSRRLEEVSGGPKFIYEPHREQELDGGALEPTRVAVPVLPASQAATTDQPVRALVTFYVDETGRVRLPNVESSLPPPLVPLAITALQQWAFKPPRIKGQPVLVHTARALAFRGNDAPAAAS